MNIAFLLVTCIIAIAAVSGCIDPQPTPQVNISFSGLADNVTEALTSGISTMREVKVDEIGTFEGVKGFADNINDIVRILNEQNNMFDIPTVDVTRENWEKVSKVVEEYSPTMSEYNSLVTSAKAYRINKTELCAQEFYKSAGLFGVSLTVIQAKVFYKPAYEIVGSVSRAVKLNTLAFKCPACVGIVESRLHWLLRNDFVEAASQTAGQAADYISGAYNNMVSGGL